MIPSLPENLRLCCVIEGENLAFTVDISAQADVVDLKKKIQSERAMDILQGVGPHILELWKVCIVDEGNVMVHPTAYLAQRRKRYCRQTSRHAP